MTGTTQFIHFLNQNKERVERFETLLEKLGTHGSTEQKAVQDKVRAIDTFLNQLTAPVKEETEIQQKRDLAVRVMTAACNLWTASTQATRVELADLSGIWNVYIEKDGWIRTQTMDKYLKTQTLPLRPRWKNIIRTAEFVLASCDAPRPQKQDLEASLAELNRLL